MSGESQNQQNQPMLNQLLALATVAQEDRPMDPATSQMSAEDRIWLERALEQISADTDPVKKLKRWIQRLEEIGEPTEANLADINDILEEIGDLVCDMDLAQVFCALNGLPLIQKFLASNFDPASALFVHLLGVLAQYNQKVQKLLLNGPFLDHCLSTMVNDEKSMDYRHKSVGAMSAMVKAYLPALIRFMQLGGPDKLMQCFDAGLQQDQPKLAHRCAVAAVALKNSFSTEVLNMDPNFRKLTQWPDQMRAKIDERNREKGHDQYKETLEFLAY